MPDTYCPECGAAAKSTSKKCKKCGTILTQPEAPTEDIESTPVFGKTSKKPNIKKFAIGAVVALVAVLAVLAIAGVSYSSYTKAKTQEAAQVAKTKAKKASQKKIKDSIAKLANTNNALAAAGAQVKDGPGLAQYKVQVTVAATEASKILTVVKAEPEAFEKGRQKKVVAAIQANIEYLNSLMPVLGDLNYDYVVQLKTASEKQRAAIDVFSEANESIKWLPKVATHTWAAGFTQVGAIVTQYQDQLIQKAALEQAETALYAGIKSSNSFRVFRPTYIPEGFVYEKLGGFNNTVIVQYKNSNSSENISIYFPALSGGDLGTQFPGTPTVVDQMNETLASGVEIEITVFKEGQNKMGTQIIVLEPEIQVLGRQNGKPVFQIFSDLMSLDEVKRMAQSMKEVQ